MKRIISIITICTLFIAICTSPLTAEAIKNLEHFRDDGTYCTLGYERFVHTNHVAAYDSYHELEDGTMCRITTVVLEHKSYCSYCGDPIRSAFVEACQSQHNVCGESTSCPY